ncbi:hypothetical protein FHU10_0091 [Serratia fonticola]|jgi:hypothetical protein|uniref:Oligosaccharide repeat unit polymerase n=1 Tax=Serratia fonticola TaxID=47917 RepID=A0A542D508_SERFO|nr:O-antigen polymerase [Serratia fonticola]TQI79808.1 hypothetical protein FHU09_2358 [Serratia fonticola]TQI98167.1 hypothetical protein FHU11_3689 [Serratia fonticola]TVZ67695.1 hypothetical protein FHU10_0091 [Serratia fonticola]
MKLVILALLLFHLILSVYRIKRDLFTRRFGIITGYFLGVIYFIIIPLFYYAIIGELNLNDDNAPVTYYYLKGDFETSSNIIYFLITFLFCNFFILVIDHLILDVFNSATRAYEIPKDMKGFYFSWLISFGLLILYYFIVMRGADHWYHAKGEFFENYGTAGIIFGFLLFGSKMFFLGKFFQALENGKSIVVLTFLSLILIIAELYVTGNRIFIFVYSYCFLFYLLYRRKYKMIIFVFLGALASAFVLSCYSVFRSYIYSEGVAVALEKTIYFIFHNGEIYAYVFKAIFETVNINILIALYKMAPIINLDYEHFTFIKPFIFYIPRTILENKLDSVTVIAGNLLDGRDGLALVTLLPGEAILNFGRLYFIFLPAVLIIFDRFSLFFANNKAFNWMLLGYGMLLMRFPFSDVFIQFIATIIFMKTYTLISKIKFR